MTEKRAQTVMVAVLTDGEVRRELDQWSMALVASERRYNLDIRHAYDQPVASTRNGIAARFLEGEADFLLMVDQDVIPERNPLDLVERDLDVVGFPCPIFKMDGPPEKHVRLNVWQEDEDGARAGGFVDLGRGTLSPVPGVGTGCMLIARRVLEHPAMRAPFMDTWHEDGTRHRGEDLQFCRRARAAGFGVWAAFGHLCGHVKKVNLLHIMRLLQYVQQQSAGPFVPPGVALADKRLIFVISPGRCGTRYLARALDSLPGVAAYHEPEPSFVHHLRLAQGDAGEAYRFWLEYKLPAVARVDEPIYAETSHLFCEGFAEPLLHVGLAPDVIVLRRPHREVALSMWRRDAIPGRTEPGRRYHVQPDDPAAILRQADWDGWPDYEVCFWYCLEIEARARKLAPLFRQRGVRVYETTLGEIATRRGMDALTGALDLPRVEALPPPLNANPPAIAGRTPDGDLDEREAALLEALG